MVPELGRVNNSNHITNVENRPAPQANRDSFFPNKSSPLSAANNPIDVLKTELLKKPPLGGLSKGEIQDLRDQLDPPCGLFTKRSLWQWISQSQNWDLVGKEIEKGGEFIRTLGAEKPLFFTKEDLENRDSNNNTALILAAAKGHKDIALKLIDQMTPEQIALQNKNGVTALIFAAQNGHTDISRALIDKMTPEQIALQNKNGVTALIFAAQDGHTDISRALIDKMTPEQIALPSKNGNTALILAVATGHNDIAVKLIDQMTPEQVALPDKNGNTALTFAVAKDHKDIAQALLVKQSALLFVEPNQKRLTLPHKDKVSPISAVQRNQIYGNNTKLQDYILQNTEFLSSEERIALEKVLSNVENKNQIVAVPRDPKERDEFYSNLRLNLEHIALQIADTKVSEDTKKTALAGIIESAGYCGTRQFQEVSIARKLLSSNETADNSQRPEIPVENILYELRVKIVENMMRQYQKTQDINVHTYNAFMKTLGQETGIAEAGAAYSDPLAPNLNKDQLMKQFHAQYTPAAIIHAIQEGFKNKKIPEGLFSDYILRHYSQEPSLEAQFEEAQSQLYDENYKMTDEAVPYLLSAMGILNPVQELNQTAQQLGLRKNAPPDSIRQVAKFKRFMLEKRRVELVEQMSSSEGYTLDETAKTKLELVDNLVQEIKELELWEDIPAPETKKAIDPNRELQDEDVRLAGIAINGMENPQKPDDEKFHLMVKRLVDNGRWNEAQATRLINNILYLDDLN
jgi:ankyrin repeat protein